MDPYSHYYSSSSSVHDLLINPQEAEKQKPPLRSSLYSVRKPPAKPWKIKRLASLPPPPPPPKLYRVEPVNFREVVQKLTGAPEFRSRRLQSVAPPPLNLATPIIPPEKVVSAVPLQLFCSDPERSSSSAAGDLQLSEPLETQLQKFSDSSMASSSFGFSLSPSSYTWCSFPLLSPGTLASLDQSTIL
ncbi:hypothetical protein HHK36_002777 [Tetracentron sinense]|uniref:VQ domain-containing protein n=1 Tax=Tetracentron sinense TaxID=13715 RepID=A0A835DRW5_TETSI|nr:hypothetical protein HHK36_002777 [Tetracentron sinense]